MKRKKSKNRQAEPILVFPLHIYERNALWVALDLLNFVKPTSKFSVDYISIERITDMLYKNACVDSIVELEFTPNVALISANAIDMAIHYLNGVRSDFEVIPPQFSRIPAELKTYEFIIRNLQNRFRQCVQYLNSLQRSNLT